jgi:hypothetical protein
LIARREAASISYEVLMTTSDRTQPPPRPDEKERMPRVFIFVFFIVAMASVIGCKFPYPPDVGPDDADIDAPTSDGPPTFDGAPDALPGAWSALSALPMNTALYTETAPALSPDGLTLYYVGVRDDKFGTLDVNYSRRNTPSSAFASGQSTEFGIDTAGADETDPFISQDYLELYFVRDGNILVSRRGALVESWPPPIDTLIDGTHPMVSENGLTLYYVDRSVSCPVQTCRSKRTRASVTSNWGAATVESFPPGGYGYVHVSNDGRRVLLSNVFSPTSYQIAVAYRATPTDPWSAPVPITMFGTGARIKAARWSSDETELFVAFEENGGLHNLYESHLE